MKSVLYAGKVYDINAKDLPEEAKKRLGIKEARPAKNEKPEPKKKEEK